MSQKLYRAAGVFLLAGVILGVALPASEAAPALPPTGWEGRVAVLQADPGVSNHHVPPPPGFSVMGARSAPITVNYIPAGQTDALGNPCYTWPVNAQAAFDYAASIWASEVNSAVPIVINACWAGLDSGILGYSSAEWYYDAQSDTWYQAALANALFGVDKNGEVAEMHLGYNRNFSWYYGLDGNTPGTQYDLVSVVLHEICHGLGFSGSMKIGGSRGYWGWGWSDSPANYDRFTENGAGEPLVGGKFANGSTALASQLTSNAVYFDGPNATAANGGRPAKLYAPMPWKPGSSYSHLDEIYNGTENALMTYSLPRGESNHAPGPVVMGVLKDVGWAASPSSPRLTRITPNKGANTGALHVSLAGYNFQTNGIIAVQLTRPEQPNIHATHVQAVSASELTCDFNLKGAAPGLWNVTVTNPDGQSGTLSNSFTVQAPPAVYGLTPDKGTNADVTRVSLLGYNLMTGTTTVKLTRLGQTPVLATNVHILSASQLTCDLNMIGAALGWWNVQLTNPDKQFATLARAFLVTDPTLPDLVIAQAAPPSPVELESRLVYTIALKNIGRAPATGVIFTDTLPTGVVYRDMIPGCVGGTLSLPGGLACQVQGGTLAPGSLVTYTLVVAVPAGVRGQLVNRAAVKSDQADGDARDNSASACAYVGPTIFLPMVLKQM